MELYFYRAQVFEVSVTQRWALRLHSACPRLQLLKECLKANGGQAGHAIGFVKILNNALHNVHRICPEEQASIGKEAVTLADRFLLTIVMGADALVRSIVGKTMALRSDVSLRAQSENLSSLRAYDQTKPTAVARRMHAAMDPAQPKQAVPGLESLMVYRRAEAAQTCVELLVPVHSSSTR